MTLRPPPGVWCHISGIDLIHTADDEFFMLEDHLRRPSGVSYVLENHRVLETDLPADVRQTADPIGGRLRPEAAGDAGIPGPMGVGRPDGVAFAWA